MDKKQVPSFLLSIDNEKVWLCADCVDRFNVERAKLLVAWTSEGTGYWNAHQGRMDQLRIHPRQPRKTCHCRGCWTVLRKK